METFISINQCKPINYDEEVRIHKYYQNNYKIILNEMKIYQYLVVE